MPKITVQRDIQINQPPEVTIAYLSDFQNWPAWSPWLIMEPDCSVTYQGDQGQVGCGYRWDGELVGAGELTLVSKTATHLEMDLTFLKPFKSKAKVTFDVKTVAHESHVIWAMDSNLPWFLFFMKNMMLFGIGMDYERGLKMLKSQLETGIIHSHLSRIGSRTEAKQSFIGLRDRVSLQGLGALIRSDYERLDNLFREKGLVSSGAPFTLYLDMDMTSGECEVINGFPVDKEVSVTAPFISESMGPVETFAVKHVGEYPFIGNAWSYAMNLARHEKVKIQKKPVGLERYINSPHEVESKNLITEIVLFQR